MPIDGFQDKMADVNTLNYQEKQFSGLISTFTINGKSTGGFLFDKGILLKKLSQINLNAPESCTIIFTSYNCHCGRVNGGTLQCSTCFSVSMYGDCSGNNSGHDPTLEESDQNCDYVNEPWCYEATSNSCPPCTTTYGDAHLTEVWFGFWWDNYSFAVADFNVQVTGANCFLKTYSEPTIYHSLDNWWPGALDRSYEYKNELRKERINPLDASCGFNLTLNCGGQATFTVATGPWNGIPITRTWGPKQPTISFN